jgi:GAF domain-containing protein
MNKDNYDNVSDDYGRDGSKYYSFLLAVQKAVSEFHELENYILDINEVLDNLLPYLAEAIGSQGAFIGIKVEETGIKYIEIKNAFPNRKLKGTKFLWSGSFQRLIDERTPRIFDFIDKNPERIITDLGPLMAQSAILTCVDLGGETQIVGVFNRIDPNQPFMSVDKIALSSLVEFIAVGLRTGFRRIKELENLQQTISVISAEGDLEKMLDLVVKNTRVFLSASATSLMLWDKDEEYLVLKAGAGLSQEYIASQKVHRIIVENKIKDLRTNDVFWIEDLRKEPIAENIDLINKEDLCSVLSVVIRVTDKTMGVLNVYSKNTPRVFTQGEKDIAITFANQARLAIRNNKLRQQAENDILQMTLRVIQAKNLGDSLNELASHAVDHLKVAFCHIAIYDERKYSIEIKAAHPAKRKDESLNWDPKIGTTISFYTNEEMRFLLDTSEPIVLEENNKDNRHFEQIKKLLGVKDQLIQCLIIPLRFENKFLGFITLGEIRRRIECRFDDARVNQAKLMADYAVVIINQIQTHEQQVYRLEALQKVGKNINKSVTGSLKEVLEEIAMGACHVINADCSVIYPYL